MKLSPRPTSIVIGGLCMTIALMTAWRTSTADEPESGAETKSQPEAAAAAENSVKPKQYHEAHRPQFHFTPAENWTNDPNGLVYFDGEYHLFFQHNPHGINWGNMTWGHAVSSDLLHWKQLENAILPDKLGTIFSGSAVIDTKNSSGFQTGDDPPMVAIYTYAGDFGMPKTKFTQAIAYSNDRGRTFTKYEQNPVVEHILAANRDPKVIWHEPSSQWVMALYLDVAKFVLMGSKDLKKWTKLSDVPFPKGHECPEFFELAVDGDDKNRRWVFWEGAGRYLLGQFDGQTFTPEGEVLRSEWGQNCYAGQTWNNIPESDGRRIFIGWMRGGSYPEMPFNQQMTVPRELTLRTTDEGIRLFSEPIRELETLRGGRHSWANTPLAPGENPLRSVRGDLFDIVANIEPGAASSIEFNIRGLPLTYDAAKQTLTCKKRSAKVPLVEGELQLRMLVDRTSLEVFAANGQIVMSYCFIADPANQDLSLTASGGAARIKSLDLYELKSTWP